MQDSSEAGKGKTTSTKSKVVVNTTPIRVKKTTAKKIKSMLQKINRKPFGRKVRVDDLLDLSLSLIEEAHLKVLQDASLSNADKLEMQFRDYCKSKGPVTKDEFIGLLMSGSPKAKRDALIE
ncbi:MAG: hypothetical protein CL678_12255 [Bdellovibrionaceae bacterium]|nr:hypothetical protein [Pseudobdellovibrionaceae bacterium]|tara:strand:+ start:2442 stop:2807 length:366 start_codon:yes stop_codon:yes gene_type:complete